MTQLFQLSELGEIVSGSTPRTGVREFWNGDIPWVTPADLTSHEGIWFQGNPKGITKAGFDSCSTRMLPRGTILFSSRAPIGHCTVARYPLCTNQGFKSLVPNGRLDSVYGYFALRFSTPSIVARGRGATFAEVSTEIMETVWIPVPSLSEQQRIAAQLEEADRLRGKRRYARQLSSTFLQSVFLEMFGDPIRNPQRWDTELLENICQPRDGIKAGPFGSSLKKEFYSKSGVRIYGQEQVIAGDFTIGNYFISLEMFRDFRAYEVKPGDLLFSLVGSFGKVLIVPEGIERGIINPRLLKISPLPSRVDSIFLAQFIQHRIVQSELDRVSHGGTMGILNAGLLKQLRVIVPPVPLQLRFAAIVHRFERLRMQQREAERQAEHLFQTLLHRAFAGELVGVAKSRSVKRKPSVPAHKRTYSPGIFYRRAAIEAYVINALRGDKYLGRTKLEKLDHLIEYHCGIDLERYPVRDAAGPDDYLSRMKLEHLADKRNWFSAHDKKDGSIVRYLPKRGFMSAAHKGAQEIGEKRTAVDRLLVLMRPLDTKRCEIIATLYAAWNDFLLQGKGPSDAEIVNDAVNNWRPEKQLIPERRWLRGLKWMRENGLVPTGRGKPVVHSDSK